jgi:organic radical activating enzyme
MGLILDNTELYRLPWSMPDNSICWLEPTSACNLACEGCYRKNVPHSHLSMEEIRRHLAVFKSLRKTDGVSIAGGEPLLHPNIVQIVSEVARDGLKPIINTNGTLLTRELLKDLKKAGVAGFTFHIDSHQNRKDGKRADGTNKNELELNELRLHFAEMLAEEGNISCSFNATVFKDTLDYIPELLKWAESHINIVHVMVFIAFRGLLKDFSLYNGTQEVPFKDIVYIDQGDKIIKSEDMVQSARRAYYDFAPCAYLNGTHKADSFKWLLTGRFGNGKQIFGYCGPKFMEIVQTFHHLFTGKYLAYSRPNMLKRGKLMCLLAIMDKGMRGVLKNFIKGSFKNISLLYKPLHYQSIMMIQPIDFLPDGRMNMCDGCPDRTVWNNELVWSCRLEELQNYNTFLHAVPTAKKNKSAEKDKNSI